MKKKALAAFLTVCMLAAAAVPAAVVSAVTDAGSSRPAAQKAVTVTKDGSTAQFDTLSDALAAAEEGSTVTLNENLTVTQNISIAKGLTLNGNGYSITGVGDFASSGQPAVVLVDTDSPVVLNDLSIIGGASNKFPLNIYTSPNVTLNNVSVSNVFNNGGAILVNASAVTVTGSLTVSTTAGSWYGINVDSGAGVESTGPSLTFAAGAKMVYTNTDDGAYSESGPAAICVDKPTQYTNAVTGHEAAGLAAPVRNEKQQDLYYLAQPANVEADGITLNETAVTLKPGETVQLLATVTPENASDPTVTFSSDAPETASVAQDGLVTAHAQGQATITAKTANGHTATCTVTVENDAALPPDGDSGDGTVTPPDSGSDNEDTAVPPNGSVVVPVPELSGETVSGSTTSVTAPIEIPQETINSASAENPVAVSVNLPTSALTQAIAQASTTGFALNVTIPEQAVSSAHVKMAQINLEKAVFAQIKASGKTFTVHVESTGGKQLYAWTFHGNQITDTTIDVNLALNVSSSQANPAIQAALGGIQGTVLSFAHQGSLPAKAAVKADVSASFQPGETAYLYYYHPQLKTMQSMGGSYTVDENGYVEISIDHCSDYVLTKTQLNLGTGSITNSENNIISPQTGDNTNLAVSIAAVTAAGAAITGFVVIKKRRTQE